MSKETNSISQKGFYGFFQTLKNKRVNDIFQRKHK